MGASNNRDSAAGVEPKLHALVRIASGFDITGHGSAAQLPVFLRSRAPFGAAGPVSDLQALIQDLRELSAVVNDTGGRHVWYRRRLYQVASADFGRIDSDLYRCFINEPFHKVVRFGAAGATIGSHCRSVGEYRPRSQIHSLDVVDVGN